MKTISVRELHDHTEQWVNALGSGPIIITDAGKPVARMERPEIGEKATLKSRRLRPGFAMLAGHLGPKSASDDVTRMISEEREER
jgi:antitoxin (DNA-binding transcriptional repressor) of toxin-antitoxin stability system